jgi:soluble lytic murein transglycosylase
MRLFGSIVLIILLFSPSAVFSMEVFQYVDSSGTVHFTNVPTDPRYRRLKAEKKSAYQEKAHRQKLDSFIEREAKEQRLEPALVKAVIRAESDFDVQAISSAGAQGLMQLMPATAADLEMDDPFDPEENIRGGARYLRILLDLFEQDMKMAIAAYHAGPGNVMRHGKIPPIEETQLYLERVLRFYKIYSGKNTLSVYKGTASSGETVILNRTEPSPRVSLIKVTK